MHFYISRRKIGGFCDYQLHFCTSRIIRLLSLMEKGAKPLPLASDIATFWNRLSFIQCYEVSGESYQKGTSTMNTRMNTRPKWMTLALTAALAAAPLAVSFPAQQADAATNTQYTVSPQAFRIEGAKKTIKTINLNGTTYISLRDLRNGLGLGIGFDQAMQTAKVTGNKRVLEINLNASSFKLNEQPLWGPWGTRRFVSPALMDVSR